MILFLPVKVPSQNIQDSYFVLLECIVLHSVYISLFLKRFYLFIFREKGKEGVREGQKHQCVVASHVAPTGDLARNPGMYPDLELNWRPFGLQPALNPLSYTSQGSVCIS